MLRKELNFVKIVRKKMNFVVNYKVCTFIKSDMIKINGLNYLGGQRSLKGMT